MKGNRAVFLDRDGTINEEVHHLSRVEQLRILDGAIEAVRALNAAGFKVIVVTNQAAIARGYLTEAGLNRIHDHLRSVFERGQAHLDAVYYCPHHPAEGHPPYKAECDCRKPRPGLLRRAAEEHDVRLSASYVVGDKISDIEAGQVVGCKTVLVLTGYGRESAETFKRYRFQPDRIATNILDATEWILGDHER